MLTRSIKVDESRCTQCGQCIKDCFMGCLEFDQNKVPGYKDGMGRGCAACQHCMAVCPTNSFQILM